MIIKRCEKNNTITYYDENVPFRYVLYGNYSEEADITYVMRDEIDNKTEKIISTEVIGFYYGDPILECIEKYQNTRKAEF